MENKTYEIEIDGRIIPVTTKEVLDFYPKEYRLTEDDIRQYAAAYTARIKCYREYDGLLDATLVRRLLDEERLMKNGESDGFRLQLDCRWYVELRKEDGPRVAPFKYAIEAYCLDNIQSFSRRYVSMEKALLHCLNGFNENTAIPDPLHIHPRLSFQTSRTMIKATIIFGGDATRYYNETSQLPSSEWLMDNGGVVKNIEFSTKAEYDAYVQGVSDAHLWDDYHILPNADEEPQPEVTIWMRLGVTVHGNKDDIENIIQGDSATLNRLLKRRSFDIDGEAYIPASVIEEYNKENQTDFDEEDIDFPTTYISQ